MRKIILLFAIITTFSVAAQTPVDTTSTFQYPAKEVIPKPYNPKEDAAKKINELLVQAKKEQKNIFIQAGGNWCGWCLRFNYFVQNTPELKQIIDQNYLYYHLNYSPENKNEKVFRKYTDPDKKYGYPFFIILSSDGKILTVQESGILEAGKGYNVEKVKNFLQRWVPKSPKITSK